MMIVRRRCLDVLATKIRTKYDHLYGGTKLHIFVVTLRCEHSCHYCQVSRQTAAKGEFDMSHETADRSIALMFDSPSTHVTLELQGGEPLLAFETIQYIVAAAKSQSRVRGKDLDLVVTTNLALATDEMLGYFRDEGVEDFDVSLMGRSSSITSIGLGPGTTATKEPSLVSSGHAPLSDSKMLPL